MQCLVFRHHIDSGFGEKTSETFSVVPDYAVEKSIISTSTTALHLY